MLKNHRTHMVCVFSPLFFVPLLHIHIDDSRRWRIQGGRRRRCACAEIKRLRGRLGGRSKKPVPRHRRQFDVRCESSSRFPRGIPLSVDHRELRTGETRRRAKLADGRRERGGAGGGRKATCWRILGSVIDSSRSVWLRTRASETPGAIGPFYFRTRISETSDTSRSDRFQLRTRVSETPGAS